MAIKRIEPGPGQESVWNYPRPPRLEVSKAAIKVVVDNVDYFQQRGTFHGNS